MQINNISITGRLGRDPEIKYFESGACLANFSVAVNRTKEITDWFDCVAWEKTAEIIGKFVGKGKEIAIVGTLYHDIWHDKATDSNRSKPIIRVERVSLLGSKSDSQGGGTPPPKPQYDDLDDF